MAQPSSVPKRGATPRQKVWRIFAIPSIIALLLLPCVLPVGDWPVISRLRVRNQQYERQEAARIEFENRARWLQSDLETGRLTPAEHTARLNAASAAKAAEDLAANVEYSRNAPGPLTKALPWIWLGGCLGIPVVMILLRLLLGVRGRMLREELIAKGYAGLTPIDCAWLYLALWGNVQRIPPADQLVTIPGFSDDLDSVLRYIRERRAARQGR